MPLKIPRHIAVIMDGNGRWAKQKGLPRRFGHQAGVKSAKHIIKVCLNLGVEYLTLYTFSTENWKRPPQEVNTLLRLLEDYITKRRKVFSEYDKLRCRVIGRWQELPGELPRKIKNMIEETENNSGLNLTLAINYGGRAEIVDAVKKIIQDISEHKIDSIDESTFGKYLFTSDIPDPDLLIRTAGEFRISNFLLWQSSYSEIYVTRKLWPDFRKRDLVKAINNYSKRRRKFGAV